MQKLPKANAISCGIQVYVFVYRAQTVESYSFQEGVTHKGCTHRAMILCHGAVDSHRKQ